MTKRLSLGLPVYMHSQMKTLCKNRINEFIWPGR